MSEALRNFSVIKRIEVINRRLKQFSGYDSGGLGYISALEAKAKMNLPKSSK